MPITGFRIEQQKSIAIITLDNPPANTWTYESLASFKNTVQQLSDERRVTGLIIKSDNGKFFSAGADLKTFDNAPVEQVKAMADMFGEAFETLSKFNGVTIAAIDGYAMGGGLEVALACDMRFVSPKAKLGLPEAKVGLLPCAGGTQNLAALAGEGWAKRIILCGEIIGGQTAFDIALCEEISNDPFEYALKVISRTEDVSPDSLRACKALIQQARHTPQWENLAKERELFLQLFKGSNQQEGVRAFLEKRAPEWTY